MIPVEVLKAIPQTIVTIEESAQSVLQATGAKLDGNTKLAMALNMLQQIGVAAGAVNWDALVPMITVIVNGMVKVFNTFHGLFVGLKAATPAPAPTAASA